MKLSKILKAIGKNLGIFLIGAIIGFVINATIIFPYAVQKVSTQKDVGLGIIALAPALFIIYGIISIVIGGFAAVIGYNAITRRRKRDKLKTAPKA